MTKSFNVKAQSAFWKLGAVALMVVTLAVFFTACNQTGGGGGKQGAPFVEGGASLILSPDNLNIKVRAITEDGSAITVEGCTETTLKSDVKTELHAKGTTVILKGKITELDCNDDYYNKQSLTALNVQGLTALQMLDCQVNQLTSLNVQGLASLQTLNCWGNQLTALNVQGLASLQKLSCGSNQLTSLNVQGLTKLQVLYCSENKKLTALNVQGLKALQKLDCSENKLTALNVQGLTALESLSCFRNQLTSLDVHGLTALKYLLCPDNQLTELNVQGCTALESLSCPINQLPELNVQGLTSLKVLRCWGNKLNAKAMTKLLNALPAREASDNAFAILYTERTGVTEGNHKDFNQPAELKDAFDGAKKRNWELRKIKADGWEEDI